MIVAGITCKNCSSSVLDNPELQTCPHCGSTYSQETKELITIHHQAKLRLINQNIDPALAVLTLAERSVTAAILYTD